MYYTHGRWLVREGEESAFVAAWDDFARWAAAAVPGGPWAVLLRDREMPRQFVSFGPWESLEAIADFRSRPQFDAFLATVRPLLETVEVFTLEVAASAGNNPR